MPVELPQVCSILAHELRTPLSVLQGYIRLLQRRRTDDDPETAMLAAMLEATGKLSAIARQASDLGHWMQEHANKPAHTIDPIALGEAMTRLNQRHELTATYSFSRAQPASTASSDDDGESGMLAGALLAVADAAAREAGSSSATIRLSTDRETLTIDIHTTASRPTPAETIDRRKPFFTNGGLGLALVSASYVLDAYRSAFVRADGNETIKLSFPMNRGAAS